MRFTTAFTSLVALASSALAAPADGSTPVASTPGPATKYTTVVTTAYTTFCPSATTFVHKNVTYSATASQTITITNCPCTLTYKPHPPASTGAPPTVPTGVPPVVPPVVPSVAPSVAPPAEPSGEPAASVVPVAAAADGASASFGAMVVAAVAAMFI